MSDFSILQSGNVYFYYRPKVQHHEAHNLDDVQRFFIILKPFNKAEYILIIIGKKFLPDSDETFFGFIDSISKSQDEVMDILSEYDYSTKTRGDRELPPARCLGEGKYLIVHHDNHAHLVYQLTEPSKIGEVQKDFNLKIEDSFIISVKNPTKHSPINQGLPDEEKAHFPKTLQSKFHDHRFASLESINFLDYKGAELLFIARGKKDLEKYHSQIEQSLSKITQEDILQKYKEKDESELINPALKNEWV
ncbi:MAG: hypothetical protein ACK4OM_04745 [Alphaproteobacteria bacterium]